MAEVALKTSATSRLYAQYAESTQVPTYTALNSAPSSGLFRGNPNLGRETSRNLEFGASCAVQDWTVQAPSSIAGMAPWLTGLMSKM